jgi:hypothetical protein
MVVQVTGGTYNSILFFQNQVDQFFGSGLTVGPGDSDYRDVETTAMVSGKILQCFENIFNQKALRAYFILRLVDDHPGSSLFKSFHRKVIAVETLSLKSKKDA